ncbi:F0F1 ATP synthase subunit epsilon [Wolbachia endosymbiont of Cruorifilaria tuberocauda]|uniref:F0F1 ATP synthase subunit epsilon n=1 Tax=Wolbachia endosymbiont of Cruorifilaria tuberocauda TaxID=1812111 RepID=UPI001589C07A|nr:F0F1 ATP synthase subunit epsilon [Wolbachia endosymbiont of Cruorifilaria tuberocauda]QKX01936.1 F0F1 ATP synthase subunit epsilon [Wolbachia endosymbiont of Cruorifilaria tuberocauda]
MNTFKVEFFSPDNQVSFDKVVSLSMKGLEGEFMILAHHSPYLIYLLAGIITIKISKRKEEKVVISNGILEVINNSCVIMASQVQVFNSTIHDEKHLKSKMQIYK